LNKPLLVFATTIGVSLILYLRTFLNVFNPPFWGMNYSIWLMVLYTTYNFLIAIPIFAAYYFSAKKGKIKLEKSTIFALTLGLLVGNFVNQFNYNLLSNSLFVNTDIFNYLNWLSANIFFLFFPALAAILFAELRERNSNRLSIASNNPSTNS